MFLFKRLLMLLPVVCLLASCSEDFEIAAPYKSVTVVYGLMNMGDTAHYIRIQRAFLDEHKSSLDMAKIPDSNFYASLEVHLKEFANGTLLADNILPRVDLNDEGYKKDSGVFFNAPNYAYKSKRSLVPGNIYRLVVKNTVSGDVDSAETGIIDNTASAPPQGFVVGQFYDTYSLAFPAINDNDVFKLTTNIPNNSRIFEGIIRFHWVNKVGSVQTDDSADWHFATSTWNGIDAGVQLATTQRSFYYFLRDNIGTAPTNTSRYIDSCDLFVWAGSNDLSNYQLINNTQGGLTADQIKPIYTNMKGTNVLGIFTTRARREHHKASINDPSLDSLMYSPITRPLNFQGRSDH